MIRSQKGSSGWGASIIVSYYIDNTAGVSYTSSRPQHDADDYLGLPGPPNCPKEWHCYPVFYNRSHSVGRHPSAALQNYLGHGSETSHLFRCELTEAHELLLEFRVQGPGPSPNGCILLGSK